MSEIDRNTNEFVKNLQLQIKLQQTGLNSWGDVKPREKNNEFKTLYSAQMVDAYNKDLETPYIDPDTGEQYKYKMLAPPDLEEVDDTLLIPVNTSSSEIEHDIQLLNSYYKGDFPEIIVLKEQIKNLQNQQEAITLSNNPKDIMISLPIIKGVIKQKLQNIDTIKNRIQQALSNLINEKEIVKQNEQTNNDIISANTKLNQQKLKDYKDSLNQLNRGALSLEQQPNEDEQTYLTRIKELIETPYDDISSITSARVYNIQKFKDNMKELIRNDTLIDQVLNLVRSNNPDDIFLLNERFNLLKEDFIKTYGFNNSSLTSDKIFKIFTDFIDADVLPSKKYKLIKQQQLIENIEQPEQQQLIENIEQPEQKEQLTLADTFNLFGNQFLFGELLEEDKTYKIYNAPSAREIYFKIAEINTNKTEKSPKLKFYIFASKRGDPNTYKSLIFKQDKDIPADNDIKKLMIDYLGMTEEEYLKAFVSKSTNKNIKNKENILNWFIENGLDFDNNSPHLKYVGEKVNEKEFSTYGMGLNLGKDEKLPKIGDFGKIKILMDKLYHRNILSIQNKNGLKIPGFKNTPVSDGFVNVIMKLCKTIDLNINDINEMKSSEQDLLNGVLKLAGLEKRKLLGSNDKTIKNLKNRLNLLEGEIEAGNNNELLKNELYDILFKLVHFNVISELQARKHYKDIVKSYF